MFVPRRCCSTGTKNKPTSLDLRSSFVATRQSANKFAFALAAPKLGRLQEKPYINAGARAIINKRGLAVSA